MKIAVIGAGSWGSALAHLLGEKGYNVSLWARKSEVVASINTQHKNPRYLTDTLLSPNVVASVSYEDCIRGAAACLVVTPSHLLRGVARAIGPVCPDDLPILICSKGIEESSGLLPIEIFESEIGHPERLAVLSGPNHAEEVVLGLPSATVIASSSAECASYLQDLVGTPSFRVYTSSDTIGVQVCAAAKNVIAIAVGVSYGLGFGDNTAALLMTRGLAEVSRLARKLGGETLTSLGLAGTGDLIATCTSEHSRNRQLGSMIAKGASLDDFYVETHMVAEGARACKTITELAEALHVEMPISQVVYSIVWDKADPKEVAQHLIDRPLKDELDDLVSL